MTSDGTQTTPSRSLQELANDIGMTPERVVAYAHTLGHSDATPETRLPTTVDEGIASRLGRIAAAEETIASMSLPAPTRDIDDVYFDHESDLRRMPNVLGVAVETREDGSHLFICVFTDRPPEEMGALVPHIEGHPVLIDYLGAIMAPTVR